MAAISAGALAPELPQASAAPGRPLRVLISTGDVSGDLHGAALVRALLAQAKASGTPLEVGEGGGGVHWGASPPRIPLYPTLSTFYVGLPLMEAVDSRSSCK